MDRRTAAASAIGAPTVTALTVTALAVTALAALPGCSTSLPAGAGRAPILTVLTGLYPLAEAARAIGGSKARVNDPVPYGTNPLTYAPDPDAVAAAGLVVDVGGGFQPAFEAAAASAHQLVALRPGGPGTDPYIWLDPKMMAEVVSQLAAAMEAADPAAAPLFRRNATSYTAEVQSLAIDFSSTLSVCPGNRLVTADSAFSAMAADYQLSDLVVDPADVDQAVRAVKDNSIRAVISEPWVDDTAVTAAGTGASVPVRTIDTLAGAPPGGWPRGSTYTTLMERNLSALTGVLGCGPQTQ